MASDDGIDLDTDQIKNWRSIITLIIFVVTNVIVLFPFHVPIYLPRIFCNAILDILSAIRIISPRQDLYSKPNDYHDGKLKPFVRFGFAMNFVTAPLIADLFLLAILAIGSKEVHDGTVGARHIYPIDIMAFFITLAYIAISIDASGLIRYLAFKVLQKGGEGGHRLYFYLYVFFFALASFIGNDPIILSGTAFLAYMTRVSNNIVHPRAWIFMQFAVANIGSAILVSSNPTNLVLAGAFNIKFIDYTANMVVPVLFTAVLLFPFLLWIIFPYESLIPRSIKLHTLPDEVRDKKPVNPNIPHHRGSAEEDEDENNEEGKRLSLEEIMNPFLDKGGAGFGAAIMAITLVTILVLNATSQDGKAKPVFWVTLPAAFVMFCWDVGFGWYHRHETREIAQKGRQEIEQVRAERAVKEAEDKARQSVAEQEKPDGAPQYNLTLTTSPDDVPAELAPVGVGSDDLRKATAGSEASPATVSNGSNSPYDLVDTPSPDGETEEKSPASADQVMELLRQKRRRATLTSRCAEGYRWCQETFPTVTAVVAHLPFALVPFGLTMFVLVQALVTKGWVPVFAYGWDHWVDKTGVVGAIGGMGFLSVILCNFAGTNIGTTILLCRVVQTWEEIHRRNGIPISERTFWATVYSMAIGVNYGAFSTAFSASLAGLLWRDILGRKHIRVRSLEFARVNLPIIALSMIVGLTVLVGEIYIIRKDQPYHLGKGQPQ
ncbi:hypothetical protein LTR37_006829 [Vermiconidia calcicola]|uniref:Uncharacterized protein n=1 Tax=Vermiconidia calcicola TaxID=1690605 RepID=A0ACC3NGY2_9PEZI|nr:hypothetical protein LTR37_006829 [Vermiconidia calcicola]